MLLGLGVMWLLLFGSAVVDVAPGVVINSLSGNRPMEMAPQISYLSPSFYQKSSIFHPPRGAKHSATSARAAAGVLL